MTGTDRALAERLPVSTGMPNEVIIHKSHHLSYKQVFRAPGATLVEIGGLNRTEEWELESAINERTAAVVYIDSFNVRDGALDFQRWLRSRIDLGRR